MCVIAIYEKGLALNKQELETCFYNNPDGAGYMVQTKDGIRIEKGFFTFEDFWNAVKDLPVNVDRLFHFRIATSGKISVGCCHPFPVTSDYKKMGMAKVSAPLGFAHNGILEDFTPKQGMKSNKSDTMVFNHDILSKIGPTIMSNQGVQELLEYYNPSRFAVMDSKKTVMIGGWFNSRESGAWYSNTSYEPSKWDLIDNGWESEYEPEWPEDLWMKVKDDNYDDNQIDAIAAKLEDALDIIIYDWTQGEGEILFTYQPGVKTLKNSGIVDGIEWKKVKI